MPSWATPQCWDSSGGVLVSLRCPPSSARRYRYAAMHPSVSWRGLWGAATSTATATGRASGSTTCPACPTTRPPGRRRSSAPRQRPGRLTNRRANRRAEVGRCRSVHFSPDAGVSVLPSAQAEALGPLPRWLQGERRRLSFDQQAKPGRSTGRPRVSHLSSASQRQQFDRQSWKHLV